MSWSNFQLYVFDGLNKSNVAPKIYESTFDCWYEVWTDAFRNLSGAKRLHSNDFTRQPEIYSIVNGSKCAGLFCVLPIEDFRNTTIWEDTYFSAWPPFLFQKVLNYGSRILIASNVTVSPEYRREPIENIRFKEMIVHLGVKRLVNSNYDLMTGTMRKNKGMDKAGEQGGATTLLRSQQMHGVDIEIVGFTQSGVNKNFPEPVDKLWDNRIDCLGVTKNGHVDKLPALKVA